MTAILISPYPDQPPRILRLVQAQLDVVPTLECNYLWVRAIVGGLIKGAAGSQKFLWYRVLSQVVDAYKKSKQVIGEDQEGS